MRAAIRGEGGRFTDRWTREEKKRLAIWAAVWVATRLLIVVQVGFLKPQGPEYQDVYTYEGWSHFITSTHVLPQEETWQYPPGAAFLLLIPRIGGGSYGIKFVILMLLFDLAGLWLMTRFAKEGGKDTGVWIWLLAMPLLYAFPVLRFDLAPTALAMGALLVIQRRPRWFGALAGLGAMVKVWPLLVLFGEWNRRRLLQAVAAAVVVAVLIFAVTELALAEPFRFLKNQGDRGLQIESVAATPWQLRQVIDDKEPPTAQRFGTIEIDSHIADLVSHLLDVLNLVLFIGAALWWLLRERGIRRGREDLESIDLGRDLVFTLVLLFIVFSRVLSPQYMIWMVGLSAVVLSSGRTRIRRAAWVSVFAILLTFGLYASPANFVLRNVALLYAAIDASVVLGLAVLPGERFAAWRSKPAADPGADPVAET